MFQHRIFIDQSAVYAMINTFTDNLYNAEQFAAREIENRIRYQVFDKVIHRLGMRAGRGFPIVYREHLSAFMRVNVPIDAIVTGGGHMEVSFDFSGLGGWSELEYGAHHRALIAEEPGSVYGTTRTGKPKYNPHPAQVELPYSQEPLMNDAERRKEFWEKAVVGQEIFITNFRKGSGYLPVTAPSFEEVAAARVEAWVTMGVAPEWLWLEYGFDESEPRVPPMDFSRTIKLISTCVASKIYEGALVGLVHLAEAAGGAIGVGSAGRPFQKTTGRFVAYKEEIDQSTADTSGCFGSI